MPNGADYGHPITSRPLTVADVERIVRKTLENIMPGDPNQTLSEDEFRKMLAEAESAHARDAKKARETVDAAYAREAPPPRPDPQPEIPQPEIPINVHRFIIEASKSYETEDSLEGAVVKGTVYYRSRMPRGDFQVYRIDWSRPQGRLAARVAPVSDASISVGSPTLNVGQGPEPLDRRFAAVVRLAADTINAWDRHANNHDQRS